MSNYDNCKRTRDTASIMLERFYINDIPVCMSWYGDSEHKQEACLFLQFKKFGLVPACAFTGKDTNDEPDVINRVPEWCPLHTQQAKLKDPDNVFVKANLDGTEEVVKNPYKEEV